MNITPFWKSFSNSWRERLSLSESLAVEKKVTESLKSKLDQLKVKKTKSKIPSIEESIFGDIEGDEDDL